MVVSLSLCEPVVDGLDVPEKLIATEASLGGSDEVWWERFPVICEALEVSLDALLKCLSGELVGLGEYNAERHSALSEPSHEFEVHLLWGMPAVDKHKKVCELLALQNVAGYHVLQLRAFGLAPLGKSVAWEVYEEPSVCLLGGRIV